MSDKIFPSGITNGTLSDISDNAKFLGDNGAIPINIPYSVLAAAITKYMEDNSNVISGHTMSINSLSTNQSKWKAVNVNVAFGGNINVDVPITGVTATSVAIAQRASVYTGTGARIVSCVCGAGKVTLYADAATSAQINVSIMVYTG